MNILIVDDDTDMRILLSEIVDRRPGFRVIGKAQNGAEAIQRIAELNPHVVIMDIDMPVMDGIEATRHIRHKFPEVVVLAFTGTGDMNLVDQMLEAGASGYVLKENMSNEISYYLGALPRAGMEEATA